MNHDTWSVVASFCNETDYLKTTLINSKMRKIYQKFNELEVPDFNYNCTYPMPYWKKYVTLPIIRYLCEYKYDQLNKAKMLMIACRFGKLDVVKYLIETIKITLNDHTLLGISCKCKNTFDYLMTLEDPILKSKKSLQWAFFYALNSKLFECVIILLKEKHLDPNINGYEYFLTACKDGEYEIVKIYIDNKLISTNDVIKYKYDVNEPVRVVNVVYGGLVMIHKAQYYTFGHAKIEKLLFEFIHPTHMNKLILPTRKSSMYGRISTILTIGLVATGSYVAHKLGFFGQIREKLEQWLS
jgi:hypothetical protein